MTGIWATLRRWLYQLIVRSHIIYYSFPLTRKRILPWLFKRKDNSEDKVVDKSGNSFRVSRVNGRVYPPFDPANILQVPRLTMRKSDILLCGFPKTGCHWTHEILHMLVTRQAKLSRYGKASLGMMEAVPGMILDSVPSPRLLNSHFWFEGLPEQVKTKKVKIVFTTRNPKDTVVSFYNHVKNIKHLYHYEGMFDDYFDLFMNGENDYGSYFDYMLSWDKHIRNPSTNDILMITFEELNEDTVAAVKKLAKFINVCITDQFAQDIADAANINNVRKLRTQQGSLVTKLFRKGKVGDWRNWLTDEQSEAIDRVWQERMTGILYQPTYDL